MEIELKHIHKHFGPVHANNDINVTFGEGRIIGILGENGAGKSTLMKILSGFQPASSGEIWIDGRHVDYTGPLAAISHGIGMLQQDPLDVGAFTVLENFMYGQESVVEFNRPKRKVDTSKLALLALLGLLVLYMVAYGVRVIWQRLTDYPRHRSKSQLTDLSSRFGFSLDPETPIEFLSIAQRQQLEIIRLLALGVNTLILDEPTTGISAEQKTILFKSLKRLASTDSKTVLLVSHKLEDVIALCDEVIVLRAGELVGSMDIPTGAETMDSSQVGAIKSQLVTLMFGQELAPETRDDVPIGEPVFVVDKINLQNARLQINDLSLQVRAGEVIGLAGLDGSGQGLFMRGIVGLVNAESGKVSANGKSIVKQASAKQRSFAGRYVLLLRRLWELLTQSGGAVYRQFLRQGVVFGAAGRLEEGLIAGLTLTEHIALVADNKAMIDWKAAQKHTHHQIERYKVRGRATDTIEQLSGGNQQRTLMGLLPEDATLLVLEQPTRGLDVESARWIWHNLLSRRENGTAIIFSSAELDELVTYSDRILVFYAGRVHEVTDVKHTSIDELGHLIGGEFGRKEVVDA